MCLYRYVTYKSYSTESVAKRALELSSLLNRQDRKKLKYCSRCLKIQNNLFLERLKKNFLQSHSKRYCILWIEWENMP